MSDLVVPDASALVAVLLDAGSTSYVAVAELTQSPLVTLDRRIAGAAGLRCEVVCPRKDFR